MRIYFVKENKSEIWTIRFNRLHGKYPRVYMFNEHKGKNFPPHYVICVGLMLIQIYPVGSLEWAMTGDEHLKKLDVK